MIMIASLVIPTHNRSASLKKMLQTLEQQSYPLDEFEVIVVADGCKDNTVAMMNSYQSELNLIITELPGVGAASARNQGASLAKGKYLIFADDDMELSEDFIKEHINAHRNENIVAIGYSPFKLESNASVQRMTLREWWEEKFQQMRQSDHRFKYSDLTSGNFSISSELFRILNGFDTSLMCREDYELGFRLIKAGAEFSFVYRAKAVHNDEVTNLRRSLQRKKSEGIADIQIKSQHSDFVNSEALFYLSQRPFSKSVLLKGIQLIPGLLDLAAWFGAASMDCFERFNLPIPWLKMNKRLHQYWYLRGIMQIAGSSKALHELINTKTGLVGQDKKISIDLQKGLRMAEEEIDRQKPLTVDIFYGQTLIGTMHHEAGAEPIKGRHLRKMLKQHFFEQLAGVLYPAEVFRKRI